MKKRKYRILKKISGKSHNNNPIQKNKKVHKNRLFPSPAALHLSKSGPAGFEKS
jgi:hypothetical protein